MNFAKRTMLVLGCAFFSVVAHGAFEPWLKGPCAQDAKKLCGEVITSGGDVMGCMRTHEKELSSECKLKPEARRAEAMDAVGDIKRDCAADIEKFCKRPSEPAPGDAVTGPHGCMKDHYASLSPACKAHYDAMNSRRDKHRPKVDPKEKTTPAAQPTTTSTERRRLSPAERVLVLARAATRD